jgi:hypothetical protein
MILTTELQADVNRYTISSLFYLQIANLWKTLAQKLLL